MRFSMLAVVLGAFVVSCGIVYADTTGATSSASSNLQSQIDQNQQQINQLNGEIAQYQQQLNLTQQQGQTLQNTIGQLNLSIKKTNTSIQITNKQINTTQLQIQQLSDSISGDEASIANLQKGLGESIRILNETDTAPLSVQLLTSDGIQQAWQDIDDVETIQGAINTTISQLATEKQTLNDHKSAQLVKNQQLQQQQQQLTVQQGSLSATKETQSQLLAQTKSQEAAYQAIIAQKKAQESQFEQQLNNLKAQYNQTVNQNQILGFAPGTLSWPIGGKIRITQYFGNTNFADAHQALYSGHGHDGLDISAPIGTPVMAALDGVILATGNTDATPSCVGGSFGKWVMIQHNNGINTMYAHLSKISVTQGQQVSTGEVIGYSGETGYATGPHLHFGVYVSSVTKIIPLGQATGGHGACSTAVMPVPPVSGYLNPLNYLPAL
ncbi:MAG: peptidoglycan DD-metalloendopeptidase family protein [Candidatus Pacebacteria bacterium]|nr:peptidoglycan DD-metalloendopeptidase family protein [Candidatus Paceibacterota bacterium]